MDHNTEQADPLTSGQILREAREQCGLTVAQVADSLRLSKQVIRDIETDNFDRFPAAIYLRGYLRSYSKLVNLSEDAFYHMFAQVNLPDYPERELVGISNPPIFQHQQRRSVRWLRFLGWAVILLLVGGVVLWWSGHNYSPATLVAETVPQVVALSPSKLTVVSEPASTASKVQSPPSVKVAGHSRSWPRSVERERAARGHTR